MKKLILLTLFILSCATGDGHKSQDLKILNTYVEVEILSLDPQRTYDVWSGKIVPQIMEGLVKYNENNELTGLLAENWKYEEGGKRLTIQLKNNVYFQDNQCFPGGAGRKMTAQDVKYSLERNNVKGATDIKYLLSIKGYDIENLPDRPGNVEGIRVIDDNTVTIEFNEPNATFLPSLSRTFGFIVPVEAVTYYGENFRRNPVGTGPFKLEVWENNGSIILSKNENYWGRDSSGNKLPYVDGAVYKLIKAPVLQLTSFTNGELDILEVSNDNFASIFKNEALDLTDLYQDMECKVVKSALSFSTSWIAYSIMPNNPLENVDYSNIELFNSNVKLRQAINFAIDRDAIVRDILGEWYAYPAKGTFPPTISTYNEEEPGYYYNLAKAKQLLQEAGYPEGRGLNPIEIVIADGTDRAKLGRFVKEGLEEIGISSTIHLVPYSEKNRTIRETGAVINMDGWTLDYPNPMNYFEPASYDFGPEFRQKVFYEVDEEKRHKLLQEWEQMEIAESMKIYLYHKKAPIYITHSSIENFMVVPAQNINLKFVRKN